MMRDLGPVGPDVTFVRPAGLGYWYALDEETGAPIVVLVLEVDGLDRPIGVVLEPDEAARLAMTARDRAERVWTARDASSLRQESPVTPIVGAPFTLPGFIPAEHQDDERDPDNDPDQEGPDDGL